MTSKALSELLGGEPLAEKDRGFAFGVEELSRVCRPCRAATAGNELLAGEQSRTRDMGHESLANV